MSKKVIAVLSVLVLLFAGAVMAEVNPPLLPGDGLFTAGQALENAQLDMAENALAEAGLLDEFAGRGLEVIELLLLGETPNRIPDVAATLAQRERRLGELLAEIEGSDTEDVFAAFAAAIERRTERLDELSEQRDLPDEAIAGMTQALRNQEAALVKAREGYNNAMANREEAKNRVHELSEQVDGLDTDDTEDEDGPPVDLPQPGRPESPGRP